jgi:hypothetical protein
MRKKIEHTQKPMLQDLLHDYEGKIKVDTIKIKNGTVIYTEHAENSKEPGNIRFKNMHAVIYNVTNDTAYKAQNIFTEIKGDAILMGTAKVAIDLKAKLFDSTNTFLLSGNLTRMDVRQLNPMLERNTFIHVESGNIDTMYFNLTADKKRATGKLTVLYNILFVKAESQYAVVPASLMQLFLSAITSKTIQDANPMPGENVRTGVIDCERDPEKVITNYCFMAIVSGIKSTLEKNQK